MSRRALRWKASRRRDDSGAAAVEFAIIATLLFLLLFGILQYGLYFWAYQSGAHAAREGARRSAVGPHCTTLQAYVEDRVGGAAPGPITVARNFAKGESNVGPTPGDEVGDVVEVTVTFDAINLNIPLIPLPSGGTITEVAKSRIENLPTTPEVCE